jgi:hypothetical protein
MESVWTHYRLTMDIPQTKMTSNASRSETLEVIYLLYINTVLTAL